VGKTKGNYGRYHMCYPSLGPGMKSFKAQMTASRAVFILHYHRPDMIAEPGTGHVSHLCHNPRCVNVAHLHLESPEANNRRKTCQFNRESRAHVNQLFPIPSPLTAGSGDLRQPVKPRQYTPHSIKASIRNRFFSGPKHQYENGSFQDHSNKREKVGHTSKTQTHQALFIYP
jgi:hypothetical protein